MITLRSAVLLSVAALACDSVHAPDPADPIDGADDSFLAAKADGLVPDERAAKNIVAHRDGADAARGTGDDDRFDTLAELDQVKYVGPASFEALVAWVRDEGLVVPSPTSDHPCLIISEYVEGQGINNKGLEVMNCGTAPLALGDFAVCLIRNGDRKCTLTATLGSRLLAPGDVTTVCRTKGGTLNDPFATLRDHCETEIAGTATWDGDDRVMIVRRSDLVPTDMLGRPGYRPPSFPWEDVNLRRCSVAPVTDTSEFYREQEHFTRHRRHDLGDFGKPPALTGCPL